MLNQSVKFGLLFYTTVSLAKPVVEQTPVPDLWVYLANDKLLAPVLVVTLGHWITTLAKWAFSNTNKRLKHIEEMVDHIPRILERLEQTPTRDQVDIKILRAFRDKEL